MATVSYEKSRCKRKDKNILIEPLIQPILCYVEISHIFKSELLK